MWECAKCGEGMICSKCTPKTTESNGTIVVTHKDSSYNGGMPNHLIIAPSRTSARRGEYSLAVIVGDNFHKQAHYEFRDMTVSEMAHWIANRDLDYMMEIFKLNKNQKVPFRDLQNELKRHTESN